LCIIGFGDIFLSVMVLFYTHAGIFFQVCNIFV